MNLRNHPNEGTTRWWLIWLMLALSLAGGAAPAQAEYDSKGKRDPFVPLVRDGRWIGAGMASAGSQADVLLVGILWDPTGESLALINDTEVKVGEMIAGYRVSEIRPDAVVLVRDGKPVLLQISFESRAEPLSETGQESSRGGEAP